MNKLTVFLIMISLMFSLTFLSSQSAVAESCYHRTTTAYGYISPHYQSNRRSSITLRVDACANGYTITSFHCSTLTTFNTTKGARSYGRIYSTVDENYNEIYQRRARCNIDADNQVLFAQAAQDTYIRVFNSYIFACPAVEIVFIADGSNSYISPSNHHDNFESRNSWNGDYSWKCPVWR